jgi:hypothetical protein
MSISTAIYIQRRAELLAPLTDLCGQNKKFVWSTEHDEAFAKIKQQMAQEAMLTYLQFDHLLVISVGSSLILSAAIQSLNRNFWLLWKH